MTTLDSLNIRRFYRDAYLNGVDGEKHMEEWCKALTQGIEAMVQEVIGEDGKTVLHGKEVVDDELVDFDFDTDNIPEIMLFIQENGKNVVRAEQRQRLTKLLKGGEKE